MPEKAVMLKDILQTEILYCKHIGESENDERDIKNFSVRDAKGKGLINYLKRSAFSDERSGSMRTYIVRDTATDEMVGYFSLKAGLISYNEHDVPVLDEETEDKIHDSLTGKPVTRHVFDTLPGIEPANYAINHS